MKNLIKIEPIAVKDKNDVVKALTILEKIGIEVMSDEQKKSYLTDENRTVDNNFMVQEDDGGFRVQSHYIGFGISLKNLEKQVDDVIKKYPNLCDKLKEINKKEMEISEQISAKNIEIKELVNSFEIINIVEK